MNRLKELREKFEFSQTYVASILGISRQMYIKYENGSVDPSLQALKTLRELYDTTYEDILDDRTSSYCVAEEAPPYYPVSRETLLLQEIKDSIHTFSRDELGKVLSYIKFLNFESTASKKKKSKKAFFDLAGKIELDSDSVMNFRRESMI